MEKKSRMAAMAVVLTLLAVAGRAGDDDGDWKKAQLKGDVVAYDLYLANHPSGAHAAEALSQAVAKSASGFASAAKMCGANFPVMSYYVSASPAGPKAGDDALAAAFAQAKTCAFASGLSVPEKGRAAAGMSAVRKKIAPNAGQPPLTKGTLDLGLILIGIQNAYLVDLSDEIYKCKVGSDPFRDPKKSEIHACSQPIRQAQAEACTQVADQFTSDFKLIASVPEPAYRSDFWERYRKEAKKEVIQEIASYYKLYQAAEAAKAGEPDPSILKKINEVAVLLAGSGKPMGGR